MNAKEFLRQAPFVRLVIPLAAGIVFRLQIPVPAMLVLCLLLLTLLFAFCFTLSNKLFINYRLRWVYGMCINLSLFALGITITETKWSEPSQLLKHEGIKIEMIGTVCEPSEQKAKTVQCILQLDGVKQDGKFTGSQDKVMVYLHKDSDALTIKAGDVILCNVLLSRIRSSGNPYEFDYRKYMAYQNIYYSGYADARSWKRLSSGNLPVIKKWAYYLRAKLLAIFPNLGMTGDELGVASALIVGDKAALDKDIKRAYVASGTMHILAVSGMHIALLFWALNMCLFFFDRVKYGSYVRLVILLLAVWLYAMITGLSGSVLRAATMITFIIAGKSLSREVNIFNSLAASAFFLLLINPFNLIDVGFQLSYMAVASIVIFYPTLYKMASFGSWLGNQLWSLTIVTIAAQILTTPISLYYFHQFPNLFLISNLLMIPLSTIIMYSAMVILPFAGISWMMIWMGKVFNAMVWLLNRVVLTIEGMPYALTKGIYITNDQVWLLYVLIVFLTLYLVKKQVRFLILAIGSLLAILILTLILKYQGIHQKEMLVYQDKDNLIIQLSNGNSSIWLVDTLCPHVKSYVQVASDASYSKNNTIIRLDSVQQLSKHTGLRLSCDVWIRGNFIQFGNKRIVVAAGTTINKPKIKPIEVDYLIVRDCKTDARYTPGFKSKVVVIPAGCNQYVAKKIKYFLARSNTPTYDIADAGAFRLRL